MEYCRTSEKVVKEEFHLVLFFPYLSIHQTGSGLLIQQFYFRQIFLFVNYKYTDKQTSPTVNVNPIYCR